MNPCSQKLIVVVNCRAELSVENSFFSLITEVTVPLQILPSVGDAITDLHIQVCLLPSNRAQ